MEPIETEVDETAGLRPELARARRSFYGANPAQDQDLPPDIEAAFDLDDAIERVLSTGEMDSELTDMLAQAPPEAMVKHVQRAYSAVGELNRNNAQLVEMLRVQGEQLKQMESLKADQVLALASAHIEDEDEEDEWDEVEHQRIVAERAWLWDQWNTEFQLLDDHDAIAKLVIDRVQKIRREAYIERTEEVVERLLDRLAILDGVLDTPKHVGGGNKGRGSLRIAQARVDHCRDQFLKLLEQ